VPFKNIFLATEEKFENCRHDPENLARMIKIGRAFFHFDLSAVWAENHRNFALICRRFYFLQQRKVRNEEILTLSCLMKFKFKIPRDIR
jgi:hypothetical protein